MSTSNLATVTVNVTSAQAIAIRKLALSGKYSAEQLANNLFAQVVRGRFKAKSEQIALLSAEAYDRAVSGGFEPPMARGEYIAKSVSDYRDILVDL